MSYAMARPIAMRATESARAAFIRRTYAHLAGAVLVFIAIEAALMQMPGIERVALALSGGINWLFVLGGFFVVSWLANTWAHSEVSPGVQYLGLAVYIVAQAVLFIPLMYVATRYYPDAIPTAGILSLG